uniref:NADH-ubiquinone oxidoreductase chain 3 n=1 Tax=Ochetellus glaber TaxID=255795 RepID=A0A6B9BJR4_9HYME|nr:NADH dehydrogenase subunit 3 [Ochetellus glaber]QGW36347.1 NADH dehydrogenase subunit 3 [Ochetellus glaber]
MINLIVMFIFMMMFTMMLMLINFMLSKKSFTNREKSSPFECGFDPMSNTRIPFSIQFFLISLIFLIFDIEITLMIPLVILFMKMNLTMIMSTFFFMFILITGLYLEYLEESLDWKL